MAAAAAYSLLLRSPVVFPNPKTRRHCQHRNCQRPRHLIKSSSSSSFPTSPSHDLIADSTRTVTAIFSLSGLLIKPLQNFALSKIPTSQQFLILRSSLLHNNTVGPAFFARLGQRPSGYLNTPLTVVAAGLAKWLDIYSGVLMVRVLLSWFPNIPWERQPLSAIRDLCDPYLNLFRNIIPPVFNTLDISPLFAFAVLGTLGSILNTSRGM